MNNLVVWVILFLCLLWLAIKLLSKQKKSEAFKNLCKRVKKGVDKVAKKQ